MKSSDRLRSVANIVFALLLIFEIIGVLFAFIATGNIIIGIASVLVAVLGFFPFLLLYKFYLDVIADIADKTGRLSDNIVSLEEKTAKILRQLEKCSQDQNNPEGDGKLLYDQAEKKKRISKLINERKEFVNLYNSGKLKEEEKEKVREYVQQIESEIKALGAGLQS